MAEHPESWQKGPSRHSGLLCGLIQKTRYNRDLLHRWERAQAEIPEQKQKDRKMTDEENKHLARIGQALAFLSMIDGDPNGAFAYVEVREMWMAPSAFHDEGNRVAYLRTSREFDEAVEDLWYINDAGRRWEALRYEIVDGQFSVGIRLSRSI